MARYSEHDTSKIYQGADTLRANCLLRDSTLLLEDASIWRPDILDRIRTAFVATPDEGARSFIAKLSYRLSRASREAFTFCGPRAI